MQKQRNKTQKERKKKKKKEKKKKKKKKRWRSAQDPGRARSRPATQAARIREKGTTATRSTPKGRHARETHQDYLSAGHG